MIINKNKLINKLIKLIMKNGKKTKAEKIIFLNFVLLKKLKKNPLKIFIYSINNIKPLVSLQIKKKRKIIKIIPKPIKKKIQITFAINSLIKITKQNTKNNFAYQFNKELLKAYNNTSNLIEQKKILYQKANEHKSNIYQNIKI